MATVKLVQDKDASPEVLAVFNDIRKTRGTDFINNFWRALAVDPANLKATWEEIKSTMGPGAIDVMVKEMAAGRMDVKAVRNFPPKSLFPQREGGEPPLGPL